MNMENRPFGSTSRQVSAIAIGQGTWNIETVPVATAVEALRRGMDSRLTHIDTAEMYGSGRAEQVIAKARWRRSWS
jgi:aryl-alcohol dehydrogenase-like predicted oxidoreductase